VFEASEALYLPILTGLYTATECRVHILQQYETAIGNQTQQVVQFIIGQASLCQIQQTDVVVERASEGLYERRLARARRAMQQVSATVGDA
jgi:hypothetical protein